MKLSLIIPIYNAEKYLPECLASLSKLEQCMKLDTEMEVLAVIDGATDASEQICNAYAAQHSFLRVCVQKNAGVSAARNYGVEQASGEWITFLDADDYVDSANFYKAWKCVEQGEYDFIACSYLTLYEDGRTKEERFGFTGEETSDQNTADELVLASSQLNTCWGKFFCREVIETHQIRFDAELKIGEDFLFVADYYQYCKHPLLLQLPVLYYRQHGGSAMRKYTIEQRLDFQDILYVRNKQYVAQKTAQQGMASSELKDKMFTYYFRVVTNIFLEFAGGLTVSERKAQYGRVLKRESIQEIMEHTKSRRLPVYKRLEYLFIRHKWLSLTSLYFGLKARA